VQAAAGQVHRQGRVVGQGHRDVGAGRDDRGGEVVGQPLRELEDRRTAAEGDHLAGADQPDRGRRNRRLRRDVVVSAVDEPHSSRRGGQRPAVHTAQRAGVGQLLEVAAHGVQRDAEALGQLRRVNAPVPPQGREDRRAPHAAELSDRAHAAE
jgi:hypothetical protein